MPGAIDQVEIPQRLLAHLQSGTCLGTRLEDTGRGTFTLAGDAVCDSETLAQMDIPGHETCVEVPQGKEVWVGGTAGG